MGLTPLPGCGSFGSNASAGKSYAPSVEDARATAKAALDAWSAGKLDELARREPPIRFIDPDQARGAALESYEIAEGQERPSGPVVEVMVDLRLKDPTVGERLARVAYQISKEPAAIVRNDPD